MFDKLVESAKQKQGKRARRLFLVTGVTYAVALIAFGVITVIGYSPALAEEYDILSRLIPPPPVLGVQQPPPTQPKFVTRSSPDFRPPDPERLAPPPDPATISDYNPVGPILSANSSTAPGGGRTDGMPREGSERDAPPPPPPTPAPVVKAVATPTPDQVVRLTSVLTQGRTIKKIEPSYPAIARQARIQGSVQVQIGISETGEVTDVTLLSGHPLLREAALQAARHWLFRPTELNGRPVRAIGVITFNFKLD
jgi:protein TonB